MVKDAPPGTNAVETHSIRLIRKHLEHLARGVNACNCGSTVKISRFARLRGHLAIQSAQTRTIDNYPGTIMKKAQAHTLLSESLIALLPLEIENTGQVAVPVCDLLVELRDHRLDG